MCVCVLMLGFCSGGGGVECATNKCDMEGANWMCLCVCVWATAHVILGEAKASIRHLVYTSTVILLVVE